MLKDPNESWTEFFLQLAVLIVIVLFIRFYVFQLFRVSGPSMCPTLNTYDFACEEGKGEFIFVNELLYLFEEPKRGEIVVFRPPVRNRVFYVKRVIGVPGDTVTIKNGRVYISNSALGWEQKEYPEPYLSAKNTNRTQTTKDTFVVPEGHYVLFGDNRNRSLDSRQCFSNLGCVAGGTAPFVPSDNIKGRAEFVIWPFWQWRRLENQVDPSLTAS